MPPPPIPPVKPAWVDLKNINGETYRLIIETAGNVRHIREIMDQKFERVEDRIQCLEATQKDLSATLMVSTAALTRIQVIEETARNTAEQTARVTGTKWGAITGGILTGIVWVITWFFGGGKGI